MSGNGELALSSPLVVFFFIFASICTLSSLTVCVLIYLQKQKISSSSSTCCRLLLMLHITLVIEEITSFPYAYNGNQVICEIMGFLHAYSGLANIVAMWLLTMYYANYVYVSMNSIQQFVQNQRYTRLMVFVFPLITALPLFVHDANDTSNDDKTSYGKDHDIFCAFEAKSAEATIWIIMIYYLWAWLFIIISLGIVLYVVCTVQERYVVCCRCKERVSYCFQGIQSLIRGEGFRRHEDEHREIALGQGLAPASPVRGSSMSYNASMSTRSTTRTRDQQLVSKIFSTVGIYVMITLASWIPRTFRRFAYFVTSGRLDLSSRDYLLLTLPIYFIGICYSVLYMVDTTPLELPDMTFATANRTASAAGNGGMEVEWGDILTAAESNPMSRQNSVAT